MGVLRDGTTLTTQCFTIYLNQPSDVLSASDYFPIIFVAAVSVIPGYFLHELSHYIVGKLGGSSPTPMYKRVRGYRVWVEGIDHSNLDAVSNRIVRISGAVPVIWFGVFGLLLIIKFGVPEVADQVPFAVQVLLIMTTLWSAMAMTESDVTATIEPDLFRERLAQNELSGNWGWPILIREVVAGL
jgi:hypothetical protein